jgi:hypothetical protein
MPQYLCSLLSLYPNFVVLACTANRKHPYTFRTLANGQSVRSEYRRYEECKGGVLEISFIV